MTQIVKTRLLAPFKVAILVGLCATLVTGCAAWSSRPDPSLQTGGLFGERVFNVAYSKIHETYVEPVSLRDLTVGGLKGLSAIDASVHVRNGGDVIAVGMIGGAVREYRVPQSNNPHGWAILTAASVEWLRTQSPSLRQTDPDAIYQAVFDGLMGDLARAYRDHVSRYTGPRRTQQERGERDGYGGIGVTLEFDEGKGEARVVDVNPGGPARLAGVQPGDVIVAIDGTATAPLAPAVVSDRLRGRPGTVVDVRLSGSGRPERTVSIRRSHVLPVTVSYRLLDGVAVLRLNRFSTNTAHQVRQALDTAVREARRPIRGLVLDLRGNPGGLLEEAVAVADLFVSRGVLVTTRGRHPDSPRRYTAQPDDYAQGVPMAVLVDRHSASASEVLAAALQDSGRAIVVGSSSYGKGTVQVVTPLPNEGELYLTWSRIYAPSGYSLNQQGVTPNVCTSRDNRTADAVVEDLLAGRHGVPTSLSALRLAASNDDAALASLRDACPWKEHDGELDVAVASRIVTERSTYQRALALSTGNALARYVAPRDEAGSVAVRP